MRTWQTLRADSAAGMCWKCILRVGVQRPHPTDVAFLSKPVCGLCFRRVTVFSLPRPIVSPSALTQGHPLGLRWEHSRKGPKTLTAAAHPAPQALGQRLLAAKAGVSHLPPPGFCSWLSANTLFSTHLKFRKQTAQGDKTEGRASFPSCSPCHSPQSPPQTPPHGLRGRLSRTQPCRARTSHSLPKARGSQQGTQSSRSQPGTEGPLPGGLGRGQEGAMLRQPYPRSLHLLLFAGEATVKAVSCFWDGKSSSAGGAWYPTKNPDPLAGSQVQSNKL